MRSRSLRCGLWQLVRGPGLEEGGRLGLALARADGSALAVAAGACPRSMWARKTRSTPAWLGPVRPKQGIGGTLVPVSLQAASGFLVSVLNRGEDDGINRHGAMST